MTQCERAILDYADLNAVNRADDAVCGPSSKFDDPSNDPSNVATWDHQRDVRAELIRWIFVDPDVIRQVDPDGVDMLGARIVGALHLENVRAPFGLWLLRSAIPEVIHLEFSDMGGLAVLGSTVGGIEGGGSHMHNGVYLQRVKASARVFFGNSRIDGDFNCAGGSFVHDKEPGGEPWEAKKPALFLGVARIQGPIWLTEGFKADGAVDINGVTCAGVFCFGGHFINPGMAALFAYGANVSGIVTLASSGKWSAMEADGLVQFDNAKVGGVVVASGAKFLGKATEPHGFSAVGLSLGGAFIWQNVSLLDGATLDLRGASVNGLIDDEGSWPLPGRLAIDGFSYGYFYGGPPDSRSRLRWVGLTSGQHPSWLNYPAGFHQQPYRELAKVLRERGDDAGATRVLIAEEDLRFAQFGPFGRAWGGFLKYAIGYGRRPVLAVIWSTIVVALGTVLVAIGKRSGVMRPTWPESIPTAAEVTHERLHPLLYSFDVFLPFVNFHQEQYWWPDADRTGECSILGQRTRFSGALLRYYLWAQITAGWLLSAIFLAAVTGLIRND